MEKQYDSDTLFNFEIKILSMNKIKGFIPMSISRYEGKVYISYHEEEYSKIDFKTCINPYELLDILEKTVVISMESSNHLIPMERYDLKPDLFYRNNKTGEIRVLFFPVEGEKGHEKVFNDGMLELMGSLPVEHTNCKQYLCRVSDKIYKENPTKRSILNYLGELKRECHICGWNV